MILQVKELTKKFSGLIALNRVTFEISKGSITALIGPNGAGKTTLLQVISGILRASSGFIQYKQTDITRAPPHIISSLGLARTFQLIRLFPNMTVLENVMTGIHIQSKSGIFSSGLRLPKAREEEKRIREESLSLLEFMGIGNKADQLATSLPYGQQGLVEICRALGSKPRLLMLDEPAAGMNPYEKKILAEKIIDIKTKGVTVLLIEHDVGMVMDISDWIVVLEYGLVIARGTSEVIQKDQKVIEAYLGKKTDTDA